MPIKFRCPHCRQFLGISRSKAKTLTDCPTCGRTIRVPGLDGTVVPVPSPKLDLADSELRNALGALADLDSDQAEESVSDSSAKFKPALHQEENDGSIPVIVAEPIVPDEIPESNKPIAAEPVEKTDSPSPLDELANPEYAIPIIEPEESEQKQNWSYLIFVAILFFILGFFAGRKSSSSVSTDSSEASPEVPENKVVQADQQGSEDDISQPAPPVAQVVGSITYESQTGEVRADKGARILVLPLPVEIDSKLTATGFRVGANKAAQERFQKQVSEIGGEYVLADSDGNYSLLGLSSGQYAVLIGSRFQSRDALLSVDEKVTQLLEDYFENPQRVLGTVQYHYEEIQIESENDAEPIMLKHLFQAE